MLIDPESDALQVFRWTVVGLGGFLTGLLTIASVVLFRRIKRHGYTIAYACVCICLVTTTWVLALDTVRRILKDTPPDLIFLAFKLLSIGTGVIGASLFILQTIYHSRFRDEKQ
jgi:Na+/melibiose symporter-like transporter